MAADRHTSHTRHPSGHPSGVARPRSGANSVRRNLFQAHLTRRPTAGSNGSAETLRLGGDGSDGMASEESQPESQSIEIVVRDKNGDVELGDPPTPPMDDSDDGAIDARQENESEQARHPSLSWPWAVTDVGWGVIEERQRLADAVKNHRINQTSVPAQPEGK